VHSNIARGSAAELPLLDAGALALHVPTTIRQTSPNLAPNALEFTIR
jgi:hypothetical protein